MRLAQPSTVSSWLEQVFDTEMAKSAPPVVRLRRPDGTFEELAIKNLTITVAQE